MPNFLCLRNGIVLSALFAFLFIKNSFCQESFAAFDLPGLAQYGLDHSFQVSRASRAVMAFDLELENTFLWFWPQAFLDVNVAYTRFPNLSEFPVDPETTKGFNTGKIGAFSWIRVEGLIYDNGQSPLKNRLALQNQEMARLECNKIQDELLLRIGEQYYVYSQMEANLALELIKEQSLTQQFVLMHSQYKEGLKSRANTIRLKAQLQKQQLNIKNIKTELAKIKLEIMQLINFQSGPEFEIKAFNFDEVKKEMLMTELDRIAQMESPFLQTYAYRLGTIQDKTNELDVNKARLDNSFSLQSNYNVGYDWEPFPRPGFSDFKWQAGISLNIPLWDWGIRSRAIQVAQIRKKEKQDAIDLGFQEVKKTISQLSVTAQNLKSNLDLQHDLIAIEEDTKNTISRQFKEGTANWLDLISSLMAYFSASSELIKIKADALQLIAKSHFNEGDIYETIFHRIR